MAIDKDFRPPPARPAAGKFGITIFGLFFLLIGLLFIELMVSDAYRSYEARSWQKTPCVITRSRVDTVSNGYSVVIRYRYEKNNKYYNSNQIKIGISRLGEKSLAKADAVAALYPVGKTSHCYFDPADPARAVLGQKSFWVILFIPIPLIFSLIGGGLIYWTWAGKRIKPETYPLATKAVRKRLGRPASAVLFLAIFIAGAALAYFVFFPAIYKSLTSGNWVPTDCMIDSSRVLRHRSSNNKGTTYGVDIAYTYSYQGNVYRSNRYKFIGGASSGYSGKAEVVRQYPKGAHAVCYVNPDNPSEAVLKRELGGEIFLGLIPLVLMLVGISGLFHLIRGRTNEI